MHATRSGWNIGPGDRVEVRSAPEITATLDGDGTLEALPFMPEMIEHCGKRYRVRAGAVKTCFSGQNSTMRGFPNDDVVLLEGLRCSGSDHDDCQEGLHAVLERCVAAACGGTNDRARRCAGGVGDVASMSTGEKSGSRASSEGAEHSLPRIRSSLTSRIPSPSPL